MLFYFLDLHQLFLLTRVAHHVLETVLVEAVPAREVVEHRVEDAFTAMVANFVMAHNIVSLSKND